MRLVVGQRKGANLSRQPFVNHRWLKEKNVNELLARVLAAHGGLDRWNKYQELTATIVTGGALWAVKGLVQDPNPRQMTVMLHDEWASVTPFGEPNWRTSFDPRRIAIETTEGLVVRERAMPRASFAGHSMNTPWDPLHRAYFNGYALWAYLTTPFHMAMPGFEVSEIEPWREGPESWLGLRARFPETVICAPASRRQLSVIAKNKTSISVATFCFDAMTTMLMWPAAFPPRNGFTISRSLTA